MYQDYSKNTIITKFIKDMLKDTYIPVVDIWSDNDPLIKGLNYICENNIVKALKDYDPETDKNSVLKFDNRYFEIVGTYIPGNFYPGITSNFKSNSSIYDNKTHKHLGDYVRVLSKQWGINLLPFYNCWDGTYVNNLRLKSTDNSDKNFNIITDNSIKDGFVSILVPIKYFKKYSIYINSTYPIMMRPVYSDGVNILQQTNTLTNNSVTVSHCSFDQPYIYNAPRPKGAQLTTTNIANNVLLQNNLYLLIQLPQASSDNIVILEGDYSENKFINNNKRVNTLKQVILNWNSNKLTDEDINTIFNPVYSLTRTIGNSYAFSDTLIEYLLLNVISNNDDIFENISRVQEYISSDKFYKTYAKRYPYTKSIKGVWDNSMRQFIYNVVTEYYKLDINGYVDKNSEEIILGGKE